MSSLLMPLVAALLSVVVAACGNASTDATASHSATSSSTATGTGSNATVGVYSKSDGDKDTDDEDHSSRAENDDASLLKAYGSEVSEAEKQKITALVKNYYAAALAENGVKACSLLSSSLAAGFAEDNAQSPGQGGKTCASVVSLLFKQQHAQLVADGVATMGVTGVRAKGSLGLAVLGFKRMPEGEVLIEREGHVWKIESLFASEMP